MGHDTSQIKPERLRFDHILIDLFQIHCGGVWTQNYKKSVIGQIHLDSTINFKELRCV